MKGKQRVTLQLFSCSVMLNSLQPHGLQHARPPCLSPPLEVCPSSCPLYQWCYLAISSSDSLVSCPQSFPEAGTFLVSQLFTSGDQSIRASTSVLPMNIQGWFPLGVTDLISLLCKGFSRVFSSTVQKHQFFGVRPSLWSSSHNFTAWKPDKHSLSQVIKLTQ